MARRRDPLFQRRRLRSELRRLRRDTGLTQRQVADALEWSSSKLIRIETGVVGISVTDLRALLGHYRVSEPTYVEELIQAARDSRQPPWWQEYKDILDPQFQALLGFESEASFIREFHPLLVPGLLQTEAYTRALFSAFSGDREVDDRAVQARLERQQLLQRDDRPAMCFLLGEPVLRWRIGGPEVMAAQLRHIQELARQPGISIQVINFKAGAHNGLAGPFIIFELANDDDDRSTDEYVVFLETAGADYLIRDNSEQTSTYVKRFQHLEHDVARPPGETQAIIDDAIDQMR